MVDIPTIVFSEESRGDATNMQTQYTVSLICENRDEADRIRAILEKERKRYVDGLVKSSPSQYKYKTFLDWFKSKTGKYNRDTSLKERIIEEGKLCHGCVSTEAMRYWAKQDGCTTTTMSTLVVLLGSPESCPFPEYIHLEGGSGNEPMQSLFNRY